MRVISSSEAMVKTNVGTAEAGTIMGHVYVAMLYTVAALIMRCGGGSEEEAEKESDFH